MSVIATATDDSKLKKDLSALLIQLNSKSERALTHTLPEAILRLTAYHETIKSNPNSVLSDAKLQEMMETPLTRKSEESMQTSKKRKISEGEHQANGHTAGTPDLTVPSPRILIEALAYLREEYDAQAAAMDSVKVWLTLHIPQIEDGDNSGVQVQEECLSELSRAQDSAINLGDAQSKYWASRAKIASKVLKYPTIDDYPRALREMDKQQFMLSRQRVLDLRNIYLFTLDIVLKNIERIKKPRAENARTMY